MIHALAQNNANFFMVGHVAMRMDKQPKMTPHMPRVVVHYYSSNTLSSISEKGECQPVPHIINILCNKAVSLRKRLHFFDKVIAPVACFAAGHRKIYKTDLDTMDVNFRRLLRSVVGPPSQTNWLNPWHEILHDWNARVARYVQEAGVLTWSQRSLQQYWHLCSYEHCNFELRHFFVNFGHDGAMHQINTVGKN